MKKLKRIIAVVFVAAFTLCMVPFQSQAAQKAKLSTKKVSISVGDTKKITLNHSTQSVKWLVTEGKKIIRLTKKKKNSVTIKALKEGTATVVGKAGKKKYTCEITVTKRSSGEKNPDDVAALKQIIAEQKSRNGKLSSDLDSQQYKWNAKGRLIEIDWCGDLDMVSVELQAKIVGKLNLSKLAKLKRFTCFVSSLTGLNVSKNTELEYLDCSANDIDTLDVSKNTKLKTLYCSQNKLTDLNVSKNPALEELICFENQIGNLDVSNNVKLKLLSCKLTNPDVSKNTALETLRCDGSPIKHLDVSKNTKLKELSCTNCQLTDLDVSKNTELKYLYCWDNQLTSMDLSQNTQLEELWCMENKLTSLDVSNCTGLVKLWCMENKLTKLDLSKVTTPLICTVDQGVEVICGPNVTVCVNAMPRS